MTDASRVFVDTNVLIYAAVQEAPQHQQARHIIDQLKHSNTEMWLSRQVLREFLAALTRPQSFCRQYPLEDLLTASQEYERQFVVAEDQDLVTQQLYLLLDKVPCGGKQIHDANIVATMLTFDIPRIITYNFTDFFRFSGFIDVVSSMSLALSAQRRD